MKKLLSDFSGEAGGVELKKPVCIFVPDPGTDSTSESSVTIPKDDVFGRAEAFCYIWIHQRLVLTISPMRSGFKNAQTYAFRLSRLRENLENFNLVIEKNFCIGTRAGFLNSHSTSTDRSNIGEGPIERLKEI